MFDTILRSARIAGETDVVDIAISGGLVSAISPAARTDSSVQRAGAVTVHDLAGRVVTPAFVEPHLHLDKAFLGSHPGGASLADAIARTAALKASFTASDVRDRARRTLAAALSHGTTSIRAQTEVDPGVGLLSVAVLADLADEFTGVIDLQLAIFPQEGIRARPGTLELMMEALDVPGSIVGGCPYSERTLDDAKAHVDTVLDLAESRGVLADLHLDLADDASDARFALASYVASAARSRGLEGRVAIGHVTSLGALTAAERGPVLEALAEASITVVVLPATDLYLMGRGDDANVRRGLAPLRSLWAAGVPVAVSSNNLQNAFTPTGNADPLDMALLLARVAQLSSSDDFARLMDLVTISGARVLDPGGPHGLVVGAPADLVVFDTADAHSSLVLDQPDRHLVLSHGAPVFRESRNREFLGAAGSLDHARAHDSRVSRTGGA